jgi:hypothetical protein
MLKILAKHMFCKDWSKTPPTVKDLKLFIKNQLLESLPNHEVFYEQYFDILTENGNLFSIFDSFDETPQVLGAYGQDQLIEELTIVCSNFLKGSKQTRGILASREYSKPLESFL